MMSMMRGHYTIELSSINKELATLWEKGNILSQNAIFESKDKALTLHMEKFNKELISKKNLKFEKDKLVFSQGRAYRWDQNPFFGGSRNANFFTESNSQTRFEESHKETDAASLSSIQTKTKDGSQSMTR